MPIVKTKPTSPARRFVIKVTKPELSKEEPHASLITIKRRGRGCGRNNQGRVTVRHHGGGSKRYYRIIDFKRDKENIAGRVERLEYDPNRSANIALILYKDGERRYIVAPKDLTVGAEIISGREVPIKLGNCLPLENIPVGTSIHCVELRPGKGGSIGKKCRGRSTASIT